MIRKLMPVIATMFLMAGLPACSGLQGLQTAMQGTVRDGDTQDEIEVLVTAGVKDMTEAKASADAHNDIAASRCWGSLIEWLDAVPERTESEAIGPAGIYQRARNLRRLIDAGVPENIHIACAPMVGDAKNTLGRIIKVLAKTGLPIP